MKTIRRILCFIPAVMLMCMIFYLSSQEATTSTQTSTRLGRGIILVKCSVLGEEIDEETLEEQALYIDHAVRKTAHATEYMMLAVLLCFGGAIGDGFNEKTSDFGRSQGVASMLNINLIYWIIAVLYAISDEAHQYFVPGRSAQISDVILDSCGAAVGVLVSYFIIIKIRKLINGRV